VWQLAEGMLSVQRASTGRALAVWLQHVQHVVSVLMAPVCAWICAAPHGVCCCWPHGIWLRLPRTFYVVVVRACQK
jgi:ABC-type proline/glycine betaine transport system permease subunit